jgi:hypothetical protein
LHSLRGIPEKQILEKKIFARKDPDIHKPNAPANGGRK